MTTPHPTWHAAHIYYYEPDKTALLLDAIRPLLRRLPSAHVLRHWRQGPHLRLNVRTDPLTWSRKVRPDIEQHIGAYLRAHPSTAHPDSTALLAQHRLLAELEQERGPLTPWFPDNSIQYVPYDNRLHVLGDQEAADLLTDFYTDSTPLLFQMLEHARDGHDSTELIALGLMLANTVTALPPITRGFVSYRSHSEGFIVGCADPAAVRAEFQTYYQQHREELTDRVRSVINTLRGRGTVPFVREWADLMTVYKQRATPLIAEGKLIQPLVFDEEAASRFPSEFHWLMFGNRAYHEAVFGNPAFSRYRLLINYTYLQINRLGLTPPQRFRLCHLAADAVEDVYDDNAIEAVRRYVAAHPNREPSTERTGRLD
ncbi:thiopeptide maturation pyridine synthase [Nonomuraea insulae]|uniref:Thiopeptide maturation pyridine synthase n=1 Tax=Nonomuraea insulae TaxID=1616787 RepID=A0ABW1CMB6_9ACTN